MYQKLGSRPFVRAQEERNSQSMAHLRIGRNQSNRCFVGWYPALVPSVNSSRSRVSMDRCNHAFGLGKQILYPVHLDLGLSQQCKSWMFFQLRSLNYCSHRKVRIPPRYLYILHQPSPQQLHILNSLRDSISLHLNLTANTHIFLRHLCMEPLLKLQCY